MYCPVCRSEYRPGFTYCPDCDAALVEELPHDPSRTTGSVDPQMYEGPFEEIEPVCVAEYPSEIGAEIALSALRSRGVRAYVAGSGLQKWHEAGNIGSITNVVGPLNTNRVMVHPDDEATARALIEEAEGAPDVGLDEEPSGEFDEEPSGETGVDSWKLRPQSRRRVVRGLAVWWLIPFVIAALASVWGLIAAVFD